MRKNIFYEKKLVFLLSVLKICLPLHRKRKNKRCNRNVAQLVAHYVRDVGVASSNLVIPTRRQSIIGCRFFYAPNSGVVSSKNTNFAIIRSK